MPEKYKHIMEAILKSDWAIYPETLEMIYNVILMRTESAIPLSEDHLKQIQDMYVKRDNGGEYLNDNSKVQILDGVARVPVVGVLSKRMSLFSSISGGASTEQLKTDIFQSIEEERVKAILLDIDSPGGSVDGTKAVADYIYEVKSKKPIIAFANGQMTSGAYWIGSAAEKVIAEETTVLGSIGVVSLHYDLSKSDEKYGLKRTFITAGKYKALGNDAEPLSDEAKHSIEEKLNYYYAIFVDAVAKNRNVSTEKVLKDMADGRVFIGNQALENGMIDSIGTYEDAFNMARELGVSRKTSSYEISTNLSAKHNDFQKGGNEDMNFAELKAKDTDGFNSLVADIKKEVEASYEKQISDLRAENKDKTDRLLKLEKEGSIRDERDRANTVARIWETELSNSDIPAHLYSKVKAQVKHSNFISSEGVFNEAAFIEAAKNEIKDGWPTETKTQVIGGGSLLRGVTNTEEKTDAEDDKMAEELAALATK